MTRRGNWVLVPDNGDYKGPGQADFDIVVPATAEGSTSVTLAGVVRGGDVESDSFYVWFDDVGSDSDKHEWEFPADASAGALRAGGARASTIGKVFNLTSGTHVLHVGNREDGAALQTLTIVSGKATFDAPDTTNAFACAPQPECPVGQVLFGATSVLRGTCLLACPAGEYVSDLATPPPPAPPATAAATAADHSTPPPPPAGPATTPPATPVPLDVCGGAAQPVGVFSSRAGMQEAGWSFSDAGAPDPDMFRTEGTDKYCLRASAGSYCGFRAGAARGSLALTLTTRDGAGGYVTVDFGNAASGNVTLTIDGVAVASVAPAKEEGADLAACPRECGSTKPGCSTCDGGSCRLAMCTSIGQHECGSNPKTGKCFADLNACARGLCDTYGTTYPACCVGVTTPVKPALRTKVVAKFASGAVLRLEEHCDFDHGGGNVTGNITACAVLVLNAISFDCTTQLGKFGCSPDEGSLQQRLQLLARDGQPACIDTIGHVNDWLGTKFRCRSGCCGATGQGRFVGVEGASATARAQCAGDVARLNAALGGGDFRCSDEGGNYTVAYSSACAAHVGKLNERFGQPNQCGGLVNYARVGTFSSRAGMEAAGWVFSSAASTMFLTQSDRNYCYRAKQGSYCGYVSGAPQASISLALPTHAASGYVTLDFGSANGEGVQVFINNRVVASVSGAEAALLNCPTPTKPSRSGCVRSTVRTLKFYRGDVLKLEETAEKGVMVLNSISFECAEDETDGVEWFGNTQALGWSKLQAKCSAKGRRLCSYSEICPDGDGGDMLGGYQSQTDAWCPVAMDDFATPEYVHCGVHASHHPCKRLTSEHPAFAGVTWPLRDERADLKGAYACCGLDPAPLVAVEREGAAFGVQLGTLDYPCAGNPAAPTSYRLEWGRRGEFVSFEAPRCLFGKDAVDAHVLVTHVKTNTDVALGSEAYFCKACTSTTLAADTCWGVTAIADARLNATVEHADANRTKGCSGADWAGAGIYYGTSTLAHNGGFAGARQGGEAKGNLTSAGLRLRQMQVDSVPSPGADGTCDCRVRCASNWAGHVKKARPQWRGATSIQGGSAHCECVEATHWCEDKAVPAGQCQAACDGAAGGVPPAPVLGPLAATYKTTYTALKQMASNSSTGCGEWSGAGAAGAAEATQRCTTDASCEYLHHRAGPNASAWRACRAVAFATGGSASVMLKGVSAQYALSERSAMRDVSGCTETAPGVPWRGQLAVAKAKCSEDATCSYLLALEPKGDGGAWGVCSSVVFTGGGGSGGAKVMAKERRTHVYKEPYTVNISTPGPAVKTVQVPANLRCPGVVAKGNWGTNDTYPDVFDITVSGTSLTATRTDDPTAAWGMDLVFTCVVAEPGLVFGDFVQLAVASDMPGSALADGGGRGELRVACPRGRALSYLECKRAFAAHPDTKRMAFSGNGSWVDRPGPGCGMDATRMFYNTNTDADTVCRGDSDHRPAVPGHDADECARYHHVCHKVSNNDVELSGSNDQSGAAANQPSNLQGCTGECDTDQDCAKGLMCSQREQGEAIPGCAGAGGGENGDYCYQPLPRLYIGADEKIYRKMEADGVCKGRDEICDLFVAL